MESIYFFILLFFCYIYSSTIIYVSTTGSDNNPGTMNEPVKTFSKALTIANEHDTIQFAGGIYSGDKNVDQRLFNFYYLTIIGSSDASNPTIFQCRARDIGIMLIPEEPNNPTKSYPCSFTVANITINGCDPCLSIFGDTNSTSYLSGIIFEDCYSPALDLGTQEAIVRNSIFKNSCRDKGIHFRGGNPMLQLNPFGIPIRNALISNCTFLQTHYYNQCTGIADSVSLDSYGYSPYYVSVEDSSFTNLDYSGIYIAQELNSFTVSNSKFQNCTPEAIGTFGNLTLNNCEIIDSGRAIGISWSGVPATQKPSITVDNCYFENNNAILNEDGGAISVDLAINININNSSFIDNSGNNGGAIYCAYTGGSTQIITNSYFSGNTASNTTSGTIECNKCKLSIDSSNTFDTDQTIVGC